MLVKIRKSNKMCNACGVVKSRTQFSKMFSAVVGDNGFTEISTCKPCVKLKVLALVKTKHGLASSLCNSAKTRASKTSKAVYTKQQFITWLNTTDFDNLFNAWEESGFDVNLKPVIRSNTNPVNYKTLSKLLVGSKESFNLLDLGKGR